MLALIIFCVRQLSQGGKHLIKLMQELTRVCNSMKAGEETVYSPVPGKAQSLQIE